MPYSNDAHGTLDALGGAPFTPFGKIVRGMMAEADGIPPVVMVLMATRNGVEWVCEQIDSILGQAAVQLQICIADDVSKDGTDDVIANKYGHDRRICLHQSKQPSGSAGANFFQQFIRWRSTDADYVALADQDDIWAPAKLVSAIAELDLSGAHGYSCSAQAFWRDGRRRVLRQSQAIRRADFLFEGAGQGCTFVLPRDTFLRVTDFIAEHRAIVADFHYHDWLIYLLVRAWGGGWCFDSRPFINYRQHDGNEIGARGGISAVARRLQPIRAGWYKKQVAVALLLFRLAGGRDDVIDRFRQTFASADSVPRRLSVCRFVWRHGRRRLMDRVVLAFSALAGWL